MIDKYIVNLITKLRPNHKYLVGNVLKYFYILIFDS